MRHTSRQSNTNKQRGFAMLFTVLVMTLILSIALGISNITYKQTILSSLAKDSEIALYQADAGVECALFYDFKLRSFAGPGAPGTMYCGNVSLTGGESSAGSSVYVYESNPGSAPCIASVTIDKSFAAEPYVIITSSGNNICQSNPRQVERTLQVRYTP